MYDTTGTADVPLEVMQKLQIWELLRPTPLTNHLIISANSIGWRAAHAGQQLKADFGLYDVGFGRNQQGKLGNADGDPLFILFLYYPSSLYSSVDFLL